MASLTRERLSRGLFVLPTLFTVGNLFCGYLSIWSSIRGTFDVSAYLIIAAGILDALDGRIARMTHSTSAFGEQYDSMADLVSFGVAPAVLAYSWGLADFHRLGWMVSFLFVVCGALYDLLSRKRIHPAYFWGGALILVSVPLRLAVSGTAAWHTFAVFLTR